MNRRLLTAGVLALAAAAALGAQGGTPQQGDQQRPPVFRTEANFVRVDVYPTSADKPVLDLKESDFEVFEDNAPQAIRTFEHVVVEAAGPQEMRREPNSVGASLQAAADPRNRVFVLFLDKWHVSVAGTWNIRQPLVNMIDKLLGPDDLIGVMTPEMSASDITLARKTRVLEGGLMNIWPWGQRQTLQQDEREMQYEACFPAPEQKGLVQEMSARRRERMTLDSLHELVQYLRIIREERKAILTISEGWLLFKPNRLMTERIGQEPMPGPNPVGVGPDGRISQGNTRNNTSGVTLNDCWQDRQRLSMNDDDQYFRDIIGEANRGNSSFYTVDPRGLVVFDTPINENVPITADFAMLRNRHESLRTLAEATDGIAAGNTNDMNASLKRMTDDLSSYYLLGYYSTNGKLDGKFRNIKVRVKRPGVAVRARRGYRAATEAEMASGKTAATAAPVPEIVGAVSSAMGALDRVRPGIRFYVNAVPVAAAGAKGTTTIWVAGELQPSGTTDPWLKGGTADIEIRAGGASTTAQATIAAGERGFVAAVPLSKPVEIGTIDVRVRFAGTDPAADRSADSVSLDAGAGSMRPLAFRRGPTTGNRLTPASTFHFSRSDRVRLEAPIGADTKPGAARLVDRTGQSMTIPVTVGERTDAQSGQRWLTADLSVAALAPGDYAVEMTMSDASGERRVLAAIRVSR